MSAPEILCQEDVSKQTNWSIRYAEKHRWVRIKDFPQGITPPTRVRIYTRTIHYMLQWWDLGEKRNLTERVDGDLVAAIARSREIERRMHEFGTSGQNRNSTLSEMIKAYLEYQNQRADAGEIDLGTVERYRTALRYLIRFFETTDIQRRYPRPSRVDIEFAIRFQAFLKLQIVTPNGHPHSAARPLKGIVYVLATARSLFSWAADSQRGRLLPMGFVNPFREFAKRVRHSAPDLSRELAVDRSMVVRFLRACDFWQLRLFSVLILFGLRAAEPCWIFAEDIAYGWFHVRCHPELEYLTKGQRDKKFPLMPELAALWQLVRLEPAAGPLFRMRIFSADSANPNSPTRGHEELIEEYRQRCRTVKSANAAIRRQIRDQLLSETGTVKYDTIEGEFRKMAQKLGWSKKVTLKDFRHYFATSLENVGCPESYRRFFMGHAPGKAAIVRYTHLTDLERQYRRLLDTDWRPIVDAILTRIQELTNGNLN